MPKELQIYNWPKFCVLLIASFIIALGTSLGSDAKPRGIAAACIVAIGNFAWGFFTTGQKQS